ncbi:MAG TPA: hypothetical protein PLJ21_04475 [Pseudobdellovibrionaceae bacterium]|nr:hypothetical protein [Pseudobdellovibrionaceae bacterium]
MNISSLFRICKFGLVLYFFLSSCARPNYAPKVVNEDLTAGAGQNDPGQKEKLKDPSYCPIPVEKLNLCITYRWTVYPKSSKEAGRMLFKIYRRNPEDFSALPVDLEKDLKVFLWMKSMGHGSAPVRWVKKDAEMYEAHNIYFIMKGDWDLHFRFQKGSDVIDEGIYSLVF